jgi:proteic killer suppression protein
VAIVSFANEAVRDVFVGGRTSSRVRWSNILKIVIRKLDMLDYASELRDLASPPGNRLEALKGNLGGFHSIRINDQWRVVFRWTTSGPEDVDVVDYH